jgi:DNA polymerase-4
MERRIIHYDMDAFYAAVEQRDRPELRGKPIIVGGSASHRGVVMTASYEARRFGIRSAMPTAQAMRLCPEVIRVDGRMARYQEVSREVRSICAAWTDRIEPLSLDEGFMDVTECCEAHGIKAGAIAIELKRRVRETTGLTVSAGVGPNKLVAKIGSDLRKPDGLVIIPPQDVTGFLHPLPIERIWGVGPVTARRLRSLGLTTMGDLSACSEPWVEANLGRAGLEYQRLARGIDDRPVVSSRTPRSVSAENTFATDLSDPQQWLAELAELSASVASRLNRHRLRGLTVVLKLRYSDFTTISRRQTCRQPVQTAEALLSVSKDLLARVGTEGRPLRLLGVGVSNLVADELPAQLELGLQEPPVADSECLLHGADSQQA